MTNGEHRGIRSTRINIVSVAGKVYLCPDSNYQVHQANIWNKSITYCEPNAKSIEYNIYPNV